MASIVLFHTKAINYLNKYLLRSILGTYYFLEDMLVKSLAQYISRFVCIDCVNCDLHNR